MYCASFSIGCDAPNVSDVGGLSWRELISSHRTCSAVVLLAIYVWKTYDDPDLGVDLQPRTRTGKLGKVAVRGHSVIDDLRKLTEIGSYTACRSLCSAYLLQLASA